MPRWYERMPGVSNDENNIRGFFEEYRYLSNFEPCIIEYEGMVFQSSEAAYQAAKCFNIEDAQEFIGLSASESKSLGKRVKLRKDWDEVKQKVMYDICYNKFSTNPHLRNKLMETGSKNLEETNWWGDKYWGVCRGIGENNLGKILMKIREELRIELLLENALIIN